MMAAIWSSVTLICATIWPLIVDWFALVATWLGLGLGLGLGFGLELG